MKLNIQKRVWLYLVWAHSIYGSRDDTSRAPDPALCSTEVAPYGCRPVPKASDVMDIQTFKEKISGKINSNIWRIDGIGFSQEDLFPTYAQNGGYQLVGENTARFGMKHRTGRGPNAECMVMKATEDIKDGVFPDAERAIMDFDFEMPPPLGSSLFRMWIVSDHPDQYLFEFGCKNRTNIIDDVCYDRWFLDVLFREGKFDRPPMDEIVREMREKFGLEFDDNRNHFLWIGHECRGDIL